MGVKKAPMAHEQAAGFRPHVSIAYVNAPGPVVTYRRALDTVKGVDLAPVSVSKVTLISSRPRVGSRLGISMDHDHDSHSRGTLAAAPGRLEMAS